MRTIGIEGLNLIKEFEGLGLIAYECSAGVWTIGYGHTGLVNGKKIVPGMLITAEQANQLLTQDCQKFANYVDNPKYVPIPINDYQRDALISFAFNCGQGNLKKLCAGRTAAQIADKFLLYNKAGVKKLAGLERRRKAERELFLRAGAKTGKAVNPYREPTKTIKYNKALTGVVRSDVKWLQWQLNRHGYNLVVDGKYGIKTYQAFVDFQSKNPVTYASNSKPDGLCGKVSKLYLNTK